MWVCVWDCLIVLVVGGERGKREETRKKEDNRTRLATTMTIGRNHSRNVFDFRDGALIFK